MSESKLALLRLSVLEKARSIHLTTKEAIVLASLCKKERDRRAGLNTAGFVSGYPGSPFGDFDKVWRRAQKINALQKAGITFHMAVNEELAAEESVGTQQVNLLKGASYQGVFGIFYCKGPGLDRATDVLKHGAAAGVSEFGGQIVLVGDDHACASSTIAYQSEISLIGMSIPVLAPSSVQEVFDYILYALSMSRFSGAIIAIKIPTDLAEASATITVDPYRQIIIPDMPIMPGDDIYIRLGATPLEQEAAKPRRIARAQAFADANDLNKLECDASNPRLCIVAVGRSYAEVMETLRILDADDLKRQALGITVLRVGNPWELSLGSDGMQRLIQMPRILVVEEKADVVEQQLKKLLYDHESRPGIFGKHGRDGKPLLSCVGVLTIAQIATAIARVYTSTGETSDTTLVARADKLVQLEAVAHAPSVSDTTRKPHYCSGCPHSRSTKIPKGAKAFLGIGCHYMAGWMNDRPTALVTPMGVEGSAALSHLLYSTSHHVFQNLGDGTYFHSGSLAIRELVSAINELCPNKGITYKILFNSAVAMTGGQKAAGAVSVSQLTWQLYAECVAQIVIVAEEPVKYRDGKDLAPGVRVYGRDDMHAVEKSLQEINGVTILIYDQECAAEKRRKRKRGTLQEPSRRVVINERVCEGCNDCSVQSNCLSIEQVDTMFGKKRRINQSSCNKDYSCAEGFCPSFVFVEDAKIANHRALAKELAQRIIPEPRIQPLAETYNVLIKAIGGNGGMTLAGILAMAAHLCDLQTSGLSLTGLSQKGGEVESHVRVGNEIIYSTRIPMGQASLVIACDIVAATSPAGLAALGHMSNVVVNLQKTPTAEFILNPQKVFPKDKMLAALEKAVGKNNVHAIEATAYATELFGDSIAANMLLLGFAYQLGLIPIRLEALIEAIQLNGTDVEMNVEAFACGRYVAAFPSEFEAIGWEWREKKERNRLPDSRDERIAFFARELVAYQGKRYAARYLALVKDAMAIDIKMGNADTMPLADAVIKYFYKLLAYKDEYEVARLHTDGKFEQQLAREFSGHGKLISSLAPPMMGIEKREFGPWMRAVMRFVLAKLKFLRGTLADPFGYHHHRKEERALIAWYEDLVAEVGRGLNADNFDLAVQLFNIPEEIRGYGHIKQASIEKVKPKAEALLRLFREKVKMT